MCSTILGCWLSSCSKKAPFAVDRRWMLLTALLLHHLDCRRPALLLLLLPTFAR